MVREGPAHIVMVAGAPAQIAVPVIENALASNPYSADMIGALMQYYTNLGQEKEAMAMFYRFRAIVPREVMIRRVIDSMMIGEGSP